MQFCESDTKLWSGEQGKVCTISWIQDIYLLHWWANPAQLLPENHKATLDILLQILVWTIQTKTNFIDGLTWLVTMTTIGLVVPDDSNDRARTSTPIAYESFVARVTHASFATESEKKNS